MMMFLNMWTHKILDLECILASNISDEDKCTWLTTSLRTHAAMYNAITSARTLEHVRLPTGGKMNWFEHGRKYFSVELLMIQNRLCDIDN